MQLWVSMRVCVKEWEVEMERTRERVRKREEELNAPRGWILLFDGHLAAISF